MNKAKQQVLDLIGKAAESVDGAEAMRLTQAALNAANALIAIQTITKNEVPNGN